MKVCKLGEDVLSQKAEPVKDFSDSLKTLALDMIETMHKADGVGLAAPQVGLSLRMFVTHVPEDDARVFVNPQILFTSQDTDKAEEGCLSLPGVWGEVERSRAVTVQAWNEKGKPFTIEATGYLARCIQHEYDHLDGKLFVDRMSEDKRERMIASYKKKQEKIAKKKGKVNG